VASAITNRAADQGCGVAAKADAPTFAHQASGEYSMILATAQNSWIDGDKAMMESLIAFKRAGFVRGILPPDLLYIAPKTEEPTMPEAQRRFSMSRLEAFSDGVIAVIITIMVLELKAPETPEPAALLRLWPSFAIYLVSFVLVAIYWINHHNLLISAGGVTARLIWANNALLFCLSLIPFATAYVADTQLAPFPTMVYGALQFVCGLAYLGPVRNQLH
jgi:Endosomal/lysosomal potassium channel TMEM175/Delta-aminolevulinic acid dehydratase